VSSTLPSEPIFVWQYMSLAFDGPQFVLVVLGGEGVIFLCVKFNHHQLNRSFSNHLKLLTY
jgi:hypothetical protein